VCVCVIYKENARNKKKFNFRVLWFLLLLNVIVCICLGLVFDSCFLCVPNCMAMMWGMCEIVGAS